MAVIFGYVGQRNAASVILTALKLSRMTYDGVGLASSNACGNFEHSYGRILGSIDELERTLGPGHAGCTCGIGQLRQSQELISLNKDMNPQIGGNHQFAIVHLGVVLNNDYLRDMLEAGGYCFRSVGRSQVVAHLLDKAYTDVGAVKYVPHVGARLARVSMAMKTALPLLRGAYAVAVLVKGVSNAVFASNWGKELFYETYHNECFLSNELALLPHKGSMHALQNRSLVCLTDHGVIMDTVSAK